MPAPQANAAVAKVAVPLTTINTGSNLTSANADLTGSHAAVQEAEGQVRAAQARVAQAQANNAKAQSDLERYRPLVAKDVISKQQWDSAVAAAAAAQAAVADAQASAQAAQDAVRVARERAAAPPGRPQLCQNRPPAGGKPKRQGQAG